jgi:hypothetical protein
MNINIVTATIMTISIKTVLHTNCSTQGICVRKVFSVVLGYAECCYTECRYVECYGAQCHGAQSNEMKMNSLT